MPSKADKRKRRRIQIETAHPASEFFLYSRQWRKLRMEVLIKYGARCQCCGASAKTGAVINVDHIKSRYKYPDLALEFTNLQVLCDACNHGKGSWDETDWRPDEGEQFDPLNGLDEMLKGL